MKDGMYSDDTVIIRWDYDRDEDTWMVTIGGGVVNSDGIKPADLVELVLKHIEAAVRNLE